MKFDWRFEEEGQSRGIGTRPLRQQRRRWFFMVLLAGLLIGLGVRGWRLAQNQADALLLAQIQTQLDAEQTALAQGDVALLRTLYQDDPVLFAAAFQPAYRVGPLTSKSVNGQGDELWATFTWNEVGHTWQRLFFWERQESQIIRRANAAQFWGAWQEPIPYSWGQLHLQQADAPWQTAVSQFVDHWLAEQCHPCLTDRLPITLTLAPDWQLTAAPNQVRVPSPHLVALDEQGQPGEPFWQLLRERLVDLLTPATLTFAVPEREQGTSWEYTYGQLAAQFHREQPHIEIVLVILPADTSLQQILPEVDGTAFPVNAAALRTGLVHDLTDLAASDPTFATADFYPQIWQGGWWQERLWLMPQAAALHLLFYDQAYYEQANLSPPSLNWTWDEWQLQIDTLRQQFPPEILYWPYLDNSPDSLLSYAYNWDNRCPRPHLIQCPLRLEPTQVAAALSWYTQLTPTLQPDLTDFAPDEQAFLALNLVSIPRQVAVWVSEPGRYELEFSLGALGVTVFPGTGSYAGITPLAVQGSVMSGMTTRPRAVWEWLTFLSNQPLERGRRWVPARFSVANEINYWGMLIPPLRQPVLIAFANGRPILLDEKEIFSPNRLKAVLNGEMGAFAAANSAFDE